MTCGIIGPVDDPQVVRVAVGIRQRGNEPIIVDLSGFPGEAKLSVRDGVPAGALDLDGVKSWYVRSLPLPLPFLEWGTAGSSDSGSQVAEAARRAYAAGRERRSFLAGFVSAMEATGTVFVNPPGTMAQHFRKLEQLDSLRAAGVPIPPTLATNDPDAVLDFAQDIGGPLVYKPLAGGGLCRRVTDADLGPDRLRLLARAPVLFQAEVPGRNIRVYVVGGVVVASYEIVSDQLDYRGAESAVVQTALGAEEYDACRRATQACRMTFTGIDLRRRADGSFAVLECNPSPMFAAIERWTGTAPVSQALADFLHSVP